MGSFLGRLVTKNKTILFLIVCICVCLSVVCAYECGYHGDQQEVSDPLELELQVSWDLNPGPHVRAASAFND